MSVNCVKEKVYGAIAAGVFFSFVAITVALSKLGNMQARRKSCRN